MIRIRGIRERFDLLLNDAGNYVICFGFSRGCALFLTKTFRPGRVYKPASASVPNTDLKLLVRPGTSDVAVFVDTFYHREHEWGFSQEPGVIVDCGAYTGLSAAYFATTFPSARVIAVEPSNQNFELLAKNVSTLKNVEIVNAALWSESGSLEVSDPGRDAWGLVVTEPEANTASGQRHSTVPALTVGDIIQEFQIDKIDLLKLDIEGSEKEVLSASAPWIEQVDAMSVELHDRFKPGCSRALFSATPDFPIERYRQEKILVLRASSPLIPR
jgi:FkbM family methyltransferase